MSNSIDEKIKAFDIRELNDNELIEFLTLTSSFYHLNYPIFTTSFFRRQAGQMPHEINSITICMQEKERVPYDKIRREILKISDEAVLTLRTEDGKLMKTFYIPYAVSSMEPHLKRVYMVI